MAKHTPGPWKLAPDPFAATVYAGDMRAPRIISDMAASDPENVANARLIAQALDMLDLLTLALPYVEEAATDPAHNPAPVRALAKRIRAVLAAAEGREDDEQDWAEPSGPADLSDDAEVLASAGMGTNEDYGFFGENW